MTLSWRYAAASDVGLMREGNEDSAFAGTHLLAVADGMGGHAAGEVASAAVIAALEQLDELGVNAGDPQEALRDAVEEANTTLREMVAADSELQGMGTTVTAVLNDGTYVWLAHVGDSRAYLLRDGSLRQVTRDHTFVQQLVDEGRIAPEDVSTHPQRNLITRALDGREPVDLDLERLDLAPGDRLLLCSDGLSGIVSDDSLQDVLRGNDDPDTAVHQLIDLALRGGGHDNITCIVADAVEDVAAPEGAIVAGAASNGAANAAPATTPKDSPARRAAMLRPKRKAQPEREPDDVDPRGRARRIRRRRTLVVVVVAAVLTGAGASAGWAWVQRQYYVGVSGDDVVIYRGVSGSLAGIDLSHVHAHASLPVTTLPEFERKRVRDGIHAANLADARSIVDRLRTTTVTPTPSPTPTNTNTPTPGPGPLGTTP